MTNFEDKLRESAQRLASEDNKNLHVPSNPFSHKPSYWGWVATPAAAVVGMVLGMSLHVLVNDEPSIRYVQATDTVQVVRPVHDTLYLTQVVERERIVEKPVFVRPDSVEPLLATEQGETPSNSEQDAEPACTSIQCDGINYALLALK